MRSRIHDFNSELRQRLVYGPALLAGAFNYKFYSRSGTRSAPASTVVICLTSFPERLPKIHNCVRSLLAQRVRAEKIVLYLAKDECRNSDVPTKLRRLESEGVEIRHVDTNVRSFNKIYHALADFPDKTIVTCDDDKLYPPGWLEGLVATGRAREGCIVCNRSREITIDAAGQIEPYSQWPVSQHTRPSLAVVPLGVGGVLYPSGTLHPDVRDASLYVRLSMTSDDLWLKIMSLRRGTRCVQVSPKALGYPSIPFWSRRKLSIENIRLGGNDRNLARLLAHFDLDLTALLRADAGAALPLG